MKEQLISVVVPVRNEQDNIGRCLAGLREALDGVPHEVIVVYDSPDDPTLPAIEQATDKCGRLWMIQNQLGKGPSCAIRAGLAAATGDVVAVTMADLSDPPRAILKMAVKIRSGADVVSGSRYMRGGSQTGGPFVKTLLSRLAGLSLCWVAGVGTHDATTSFRAFGRRFLRAVPLTSTTGFTFGIEATVRAHLAGFVVTEVPSTWTDRTAGESTFRVASWLGAYLRWYGRAMAVPLFVWAIWAVTGAGMVYRSVQLTVVVPAMGASLLALLLVRRLRRRMATLDSVVAVAWTVPVLGYARGDSPALGVLAIVAALLVMGVAWVQGRTSRG